MEVEIEMLETVRHDGAEYVKNERRRVTPELARYFCGLGWAKDTTGRITTGERKPGASNDVVPDDIYQGGS